MFTLHARAMAPFAILLLMALPNHAQSRATLDTSRIIDGQPAPAGMFPYMASIQFYFRGRYEHTCGGVLISDTQVATAAHCALNADLGQFRVVLNRSRLSDEGEGEVRSVVAWTTHPRYPADLGGYDFAVLELDEPVYGIAPVTLGERGSLPPEGAHLRAVGWGWTSYSDPDSGPDALQMADLPYVAVQACQRLHSDPAEPILVNPETDLCAGGSGASSCFGDSGGPLLQADPQRAGNWLLVGLTSRGRRRCSDAPGVYTSVLSDTLWRTMDTPDGAGARLNEANAGR